MVRKEQGRDSEESLQMIMKDTMRLTTVSLCLKPYVQPGAHPAPIESDINQPSLLVQSSRRRRPYRLHASSSLYTFQCLQMYSLNNSSHRVRCWDERAKFSYLRITTNNFGSECLTVIATYILTKFSTHFIRCKISVDFVSGQNHLTRFKIDPLLNIKRKMC